MERRNRMASKSYRSFRRTFGEVVAEDLSTDSFINAVLRFVGRRGPARVIYSDNGTNFRGAEFDVG